MCRKKRILSAKNFILPFQRMFFIFFQIFFIFFIAKKESGGIFAVRFFGNVLIGFGSAEEVKKSFFKLFWFYCLELKNSSIFAPA